MDNLRAKYVWCESDQRWNPGVFENAGGSAFEKCPAAGLDGFRGSRSHVFTFTTLHMHFAVIVQNFFDYSVKLRLYS